VESPHIFEVSKEFFGVFEICSAASFGGWDINTPSPPCTLTLSDHNSHASIAEHSRALPTPSFDFLTKFGERIEGKLNGEQ
jgi:hypothetical protein